MDWLELFDLAPHQCIEVGSVYGRLTVLATGVKPNTYKYYAVCQCSCGSKPKLIRIDGIRNGGVQSCGCLHKQRSTKHGNWNHPLYPVWRGMLRRCYNTKDKRFVHYGGRGIDVCERWHDLNNFIQDMYPTYRCDLQLDRIDNDSGYSPDNCHWATLKEQANNKSSNVVLEHNGKSLTLAEWSVVTGISYGTLWERYKVLNWTPERTLTTNPLNAFERLTIARSNKCNYNKNK